MTTSHEANARVPTLRQRWADAIEEDDTLDPYEFTIARCFVKYAGKGTDNVWVARSKLEQRMGRTKALACIRSLVEKGWLVQTRGARAQLSPEYRLTIPASAERVSGDDTLDERRVSRGDTLTTSRVSRDGERVSPHGEGVSRGEPQPLSEPRMEPTLRGPFRSSDVERLAALIAGEGAGVDDVDQIIRISNADPDTRSSPVGRLLAAAPHRRDCIKKLHAEQRAANAAARASSPVCEECHALVTDCDSIASKVAPEHACRGAEDRRVAAA